MTNEPLSVVWFKRDLRVTDHDPLRLAAERGRVLCVYVYEPELLKSAEWDASHSAFIDECLAELEDQLARRGVTLVFRCGEMPEVLEQLHRECAFDRLYSHRETGNRITFDRDLRVADWCRAKGIAWVERPQDGVVRKLKSRDGWSARWKRRMNAPVLAAPDALRGAVLENPGRRLSLSELGLEPTPKVELQMGGESQAHETLDSFLYARGVNYRTDMSSPLLGWEGCSRVSPYLAWGAISMRQVFHKATKRAAQIRLDKRRGNDVPAGWAQSLISFEKRLSWHCHFMQKLEDEPSIEFENMHRAYDGLREPHFDQARFDAFCAGQTGYPMVDACVRALLGSSWMNFRMRAMLVSFASYHLWLHWRPTSLFLAKHFLDFEPGIHFSQVQMQSGTTGINAVRIYSPAKQVHDQDPEGLFIKRWVPELEGVPPKRLAEPHRMTASEQQAAGCIIGKHYPAPIVDHASAYKQARTRVMAVRRTKEAKAESQAVFIKHGSRKGPQRRARR